MFRMSPEQIATQDEMLQNKNEQEINHLEYSAYNQFLNGLDDALEETKTQIGIERSSDYRRLESKFRFAQSNFEKNYGAKSAEQVSELSTFGRFKLFAFDRSKYKALREMEKARTQLNIVEDNILTFAPDLVQGSEAFQEILKKSDARSEISNKGRTILQKGLNRNKKIEDLPPSAKIREQAAEISIIDRITKKTSALYERIKGQEYAKNPEQVKPGIMEEGDARGQMLTKMGKLDRQRKLIQENKDKYSNLKEQSEIKVKDNMKTIDAIRDKSGGLLNFRGQDMWNIYFEKETARERLINALGFDPTEGSQIKAFISAAFAVGRDGLGIYRQEMKKYNITRKELTKMEKALAKAVDYIKIAKTPEAQKIKATLQNDHQIEQRSSQYNRIERDVYTNVHKIAYCLYPENLTKDIAEQRLASASGVGRFKESPYRESSEAKMLNNSKFYLKIEGKKVPYAIFEQGGNYYFKMLDS